MNTWVFLVAEVHPLKQGLKPEEITGLTERSITVAEVHPLKQGLKPTVRKVKDGIVLELQRYIH